MGWTGLLAGGVAFVICLGLVPVARRIGLRIGACDHPGEAKIHTQGISLLGGLAILAGWLPAVLSTTLVRRFDAAMLLSLGGGGIVAFGLGLLDDVLWKNHPERYRPSVKFAVQIAVAAILAALLFFGGIRPAYAAAVAAQLPLLVLYVFGGMNALNMTDGMDGLAATMTTISAVGFLVVGMRAGDGALLAYAAALAGSALAFLAYNRPPATVFMGDSGSHLLGFAVAGLAVAATRHAVGLRSFLGPILILGLPVGDAGWAVLRRVVHRSPLFGADRGHVYDLLLKGGWSQTRVLLLLGAVQAGLVAVGAFLVR